MVSFPSFGVLSSGSLLSIPLETDEMDVTVKDLPRRDTGQKSSRLPS